MRLLAVSTLASVTPRIPLAAILQPASPSDYFLAAPLFACFQRRGALNICPAAYRKLNLWVTEKLVFKT